MQVTQSEFDKFYNSSSATTKKLLLWAVKKGLITIIPNSPTPPTPPPNPPNPPPPGPIPNPPSSTWKTIISKPMMFVSAPNYYFVKLRGSQLDQWLDFIKSQKITGVDIEFNGEYVWTEYITKKKIPVNLDAEMQKSFDAMDEWLPKLKARGLGVSIKFVNSNSNHMGEKPSSWWYSKAKLFAERYGSDYLIVLPLNERDGNTTAETGLSLYKGFVDGKFPTSQLIGYDSYDAFGIRCGFVETHPQGEDVLNRIKGSDHTHINCTDSSPSIDFLYTNWKKLDGKGGDPRLGNHKAFGQTIKAKRVSGSAYSGRQTPDPQGLVELAKGWNSL